MAVKTNFLANNSGVPQVNTPRTSSSGAASGEVVGLNSSSTVDVSIGGTGLVSPTAHNLLIAEGSSAFNLVAPSSTSGVPVISQGSSSDPTFGTAVVAGGGTGRTTLTAHNVLLGNGTGTVNFAAPSTAGYVLTDNGSGSDPSFQAIPYAALTLTATAGVAISAGNLVYIDSSGDIQLADNTSTSKQATGFAPSAISSSASGQVVLFIGTITGLTSLTTGSQYYLGTAGGITPTAPSSSGDLIQTVGFASSSTVLQFRVGDPVQIA